MTESVLNTIKSMIGPSALYEGFNTDLMVHLNSSLMELAQIGVVPEGTVLENETTTWADLIGENKKLEGIKSYLYFKVKIMFDPPASSTILAAYQEEIKRLEWRLMIQCDEDTSAQ